MQWHLKESGNIQSLNEELLQQHSVPCCSIHFRLYQRLDTGPAHKVDDESADTNNNEWTCWSPCSVTDMQVNYSSCSRKHHQSLGDTSVRPWDLTMRTSLTRLWDVVESFPCVGMENPRCWGWGGWCLDKTKYCFRELQEPSQRQR